jgi:TfoX/Sxy family transcriptional regulator of competence genes
MPDDENVLAIFYGPTLLAFESNSELILKGTHAEIIKNLSYSGDSFRLVDNGKNYLLRRLYDIETQSYGVYATIREY